MLDFVFAYLAGLLTLINPCVLPLLPIVLAGSVSKNRLGPVAMAVGLAASFTIVGFLVYTVAQTVGLDQDAISRFGAGIMIAFGVILVVPQFERQFSKVTGGLAVGGNKTINEIDDSNLVGQALTGVLLGVAWSPCIGPTLGGAIGLASQGESYLFALGIMAVFSLGAATIVLALSYGSRELIGQRRDALNSISQYAKPIMGVALLLVGLALWFHIDRIIEIWALDNLPLWLIELSVSL
ncbi:cytochrome c biogenesis CcdA family protein [Maritalea sp.]|uniref:cytochrome c biogenesis CcdA family protein n=1 Tax=Maritalea sp. TaxID=2003361 RepID=UPI003EF16EA2